MNVFLRGRIAIVLCIEIVPSQENKEEERGHQGERLDIMIYNDIFILFWPSIRSHCHKRCILRVGSYQGSVQTGTESQAFETWVRRISRKYQ